MRLQLTIIRNTLAPIRNVFNTRSKEFTHHPITTVADLLAAVDSFIQLESEDWGFEDYVVETRLNDDQDQAYEAFHWQELKDVFQEDDEVTIRPLSEKELRLRRQGGRHQVCRDGVHLIDGGAWGKGLMVANRRPKINIPPRRTLRAVEQAEQLAQIEYGDGQEVEPHLQIGNGIIQALVPFLGEEEDSEDDEDDEDFDAAQDSLEEEEDDDTDYENDGEDTEEHVSRQRKVSFTLPEDQLDELAGNESSSVSASRKRKRAVREQPPRRKRRLDPPVTSSVSESSPKINGVHTGIRTAIQRVPAVLNPNDTSSEDSGSESDTEVGSDSEVDETLHQGHDPASTNDNADDTSSSGSDSDSDDTSSSDDTASASDSESDSGESSSSSDDTASSAESETKDLDSATRGAKPTQPKSTNGHESGSQPGTGSHTSGPPTRKDQEAILNELILPSKPNVPPGQGMPKTKRNNDRKKLGKILKKLKDENKLPKDANLVDVRRYLQEHDPNEAEVSSYNEESIAQTDELSARKEAAYAKLNATSLSPLPDDHSALETLAEETPIAVLETVVTDAPAEVSNRTSLLVAAEEDGIPMQIAQTMSASEIMEEKAISEPSPKRTRLDVASSRRMLFSALGVRTPKTAEAERALRDKLAKPTRQVKARETVIASQEPVNTPSDPERWRQRLTIKAVECKNVGRQIETPPFPFKHPWEVRKEKEQRRHQRRDSDYQWYENEVPEEEDVDSTQEVAMGQDEIPSQTLTTSRTLTAGMDDEDLDDLPIPSDFDVLFDLSPTDLVEGAVIAYKELHLNQSFQPEQTSYRVARILDNKSKQLKLRLAPQYRDSPNIEYDEETGERIYNKFDMPMDEDEMPDDGVRQLAFDELIQPKFVSPSDSAEVVIAQSQSQAAGNESHRNGTKDGQMSNASEMVPNSAPVQSVISEADVSSSRRDEINGIIKEAGFDSALDQQLLEPLVEHTEGQAGPFGEGKDEERQDDMQLDEWHSSPVVPSSPFKELDALSGMRESSVPSESMVESVRYPNLSQLGLDTPSIRVHSSSHQDAQRLTPTPMIDNSGILHTELEEEDSIQIRDGSQDMTQSSAEVNSLGSEVPQTDSVEVESEANGPTAQIEQNGQVGESATGFDDPYSPSQGSDDGSDDESVDSVGLPSLRSLTSSQVRKIKGELPGASNNKKAKTGEGSRRSPRISKKTAGLNKGNRSEVESPPRSFKASQSQKPKMSEIPEETIVVDLTQSSPAVSPPKASQGKSNQRATSSSQQSSAFKRSFQGLGEKSFLKRKKTSL